MISLISFSERGHKLAKRIGRFLGELGEAVDVTRCKSGELSAWTHEHFPSSQALIYVGAIGIAVRAIVPYIRGKETDPGVIVIDEMGLYCVPILSGHLGGANELCLKLSTFLKAFPIITTATDLHGLFAVDSWARSQGLRIADTRQIKRISSRILAGETVRMRSDLPITGSPPTEVQLVEKGACDIHLSSWALPYEGAMHLIPPHLTLGVGCKKGVPASRIKKAFYELMEMCSFHPLAVRSVCSIDLKKNEPGLITFAQQLRLDFLTFSPENLKQVQGEFHRSEFVETIVGVDNVCERSAVVGAGQGGRLVKGRESFDGITMAVAMMPLALTFSQETK